MNGNPVCFFSRSAVASLAAGLIAAGGIALAQAPGATSEIRLKDPKTITSLLVPYFGLEHIAKAKGYFEKYNLNVDFVGTLQGVTGLPAVISGQAQTMQGTTPYSQLLAWNGGVKLVGVVAGANSAPGFDTVRFIIRNDGKINGPKDLIGKKVAVPAVVSYYTFLMQVWLEKAGVQASQVLPLAVPPLNQADALLTGQVDMVAMGDVYYTALMNGKDGSKVRTLFADRDSIPATTRHTVAYVFTEEYANKNPEIVRAYVAAMVDAWKLVESNPEEAKQIISKVTTVPVENIPIPTYPKNLCIDVQAAAEFIPLMQKLGGLKEGVATNPNLWVTNKFNAAC